ncbi:DcrB-related protein [Patescibacteria group bacterium]|nr:DcrB-related protein [Patescibacteria group bacterium]MBU1673833.1 DcrB-related protein [Patescibacteria group bacterium]MBU1963610.1 DcrB-related protein [Patescibacteria group bacterium]
MKRTKLILLICLPLALVMFMGQTCGRGETAQPQVPPATFSDEQISFKYPADWTKEPDSEGFIVSLTAPNGRDNMNVISVDLSASPMNLKEFTDLSMQGIEETIPGYAYIRDGETTFAGQKGHEIVFTATKDGTTLKFWQIWTVVDDVAYALTFTASEDNFANLKPKVEAIVNSFIIKE